MKNLKMIVIVIGVIVMMAAVGNVNGAVPIDDPLDIIGHGENQDLFMTYDPSNLMERINGEDFFVDKGEGQYYIFFAKITGPNTIEFGAYVSTDNVYSNDPNSWPDATGWCQGKVNRNVFLAGETPDYVLAIYDDNGGYFASTDRGRLTFDDNIVAWESGLRFMASGDIEYGGVLGGLLDFNFGPIGGIIWMNSVVLVPALVTLDSPLFGEENVDPDTFLVWSGEIGSVYDVYLGVDPKNFGEPILSGTLETSLDVLLDWETKYSWKVTGVTALGKPFSSTIFSFTTDGYVCEGGVPVGDLNGDCVVDLADFALLAGNWLVEVDQIPAH